MTPRRNRFTLPWGRLLIAALVAAVVGVVAGAVFAKLSKGGGAPAVGNAAATPAALGQVGVSVLSGVLHPATTPTGKVRQRARLVVVVQIRNRGSQAVTIPRPALLAAGVRKETDPNEDAPGTAVGTLGPGAGSQVALQFEIAGTLTKALTAGRRARVIVAGQTLNVPVTTGSPVGPTSAAPAP